MNEHPPQPCVSARAIDCSQVADWSRDVGWDIEYQQVGRGNFDAWFTAASCQRLRLTNQRCNRETIICGAPPQEMVAVVLPAGPGHLGVFEGTELCPNTAIVLLPGDGRCLRSPAGFRACTVSIPRTTLEELVWQSGHCEFATLLPESRSFELSPRAVRKLATTISSLTGAGQGPARATAAAELEERLLHQLVEQLFQQSLDMKPDSGHHGRAEHVKRARDYIEDHLTETILMGQVAEQAGVSIRTLELAFRSVLGVTPFEYIRTRRLNKIRQRLLDQKQETRTLTDLAIEHALFHLGRFSGDYKALFGELPSETVARYRGGAEDREPDYLAVG
jgi:AraC family ethanolamine operon transcriptional activator